MGRPALARPLGGNLISTLALTLASGVRVSAGDLWCGSSACRALFRTCESIDTRTQPVSTMLTSIKPLGQACAVSTRRCPVKASRAGKTCRVVQAGWSLQTLDGALTGSHRRPWRRGLGCRAGWCSLASRCASSSRTGRHWSSRRLRQTSPWRWTRSRREQRNPRGPKMAEGRAPLPPTGASLAHLNRDLPRSTRHAPDAPASPALRACPQARRRGQPPSAKPRAPPPSRAGLCPRWWACRTRRSSSPAPSSPSGAPPARLPPARAQTLAGRLRRPLSVPRPSSWRVGGACPALGRRPSLH